MEHRYRLLLSCPDRVGIVSMVSNFISSHGASIADANQHSDPTTGWFFMRVEIFAESLPFSIERLREQFAPIAQSFQMEWQITDSALPKRVVLMASREAHCLADLLYRYHAGELDCEIPCVISNHDDLRSMVEWHDIPYYHVPVDSADKQPHFDRVLELVREHRADVVVLARYMQILPLELCGLYPHRIINIHHSFLPSFAGARPYHQAHERGVKLIGATCHYVTEELDAGPIIDQDVIRISHRDLPEDMVRLGRDAEKTCLARGLRWHLEDRILVQGNKTVVFN
ncbi:formyltetrahydrofolate deformylase [Marinobacterium nitratireducens]|uniref:Formyltetrahydrofolate deformylase n=1 Tax=Marinobacterium nitratireducens TaxID=518897 RepID=A0A918DTS4_9GAMM|nr:formyltetrahydrofolate deformylase [Marinobacterium nitratireducens]GGO83036.1 formyltetrahydrofolate deformylase [Marinobacterium nitratireducens]